MSSSLENRVCLVTGGASGIGKAAALALLGAGAHVQVADLSQDFSDGLQQECSAEAQSRLHCRCLDVSNLAEVESWIADVDQRHGRIDVLVHCAAQVDWNRIDDQSIETIVRTMQVGFDGMVYCTKLVLPLMHANRFGRIVYLGSIASTMHLFPGYAAYASMKAATDAWASMLRIDLRESYVQVALVRPGVVKDTNLFRRSIDRAGLPRMFDLLPVTTPRAVAATIIKAINKSNRTYVIPRSYRLLDGTSRWMPRLSRWLCRWGMSRRTDIRTRDDTDR